MAIPASKSVPNSTDRLLLAVDGGGTKTHAWLATRAEPASPHVIGRGRAGASNPQAVGLETAQKNLAQAIEQAFADARCAPRQITSACLALAGVGHLPTRAQILEWAQSNSLARHIQVVHDAQAVLAAGTADGRGIALVCGTGSFAYGETSPQSTARAGGWGYLVGDEGSAFAIGRDALRAVTRAADGRGPATCLTETVLEQMQYGEPAHLLHALHQLDVAATRHTLAALAPSVFQAASRGDQVAQEICHYAAVEVSDLVRSVARQLDLAPGQYDLALAGGVIVHQSEWTKLCLQTLAELHAAPRSTNIVTEPVAGALKLACLAL